jgi:NAD(P)-dependent dehydrogenase (short-subunit alcohol dehydrogenase family)
MLNNRLSRAFDRFLDQTVVFSYTNIGYALRRTMRDAADLEVDMIGRRCIVTGANSGLGFFTTERLAELGASVTMVVRDHPKGQKAQTAIIDHTGNPNIQLEVADLSSLDSVREFAARFSHTQNRLDVLIHNAGGMHHQRTVSADGVELTFATHVLGPFLLTHLLLPLMKKSDPSRIIFVSSGGMYAQKLDLEDLQSEHGEFNGTIAYAQAKRAQVMLTELWAERLEGSGVTINAMHPGWVDTPGVQSALPTFRNVLRSALRTPEQGADTIVWLAAAPHLASESGKFWFDRRERGTHKLWLTRSTRQEYQRLWDECVRLSQVTI